MIHRPWLIIAIAMALLVAASYTAMLPLLPLPLPLSSREVVATGIEMGAALGGVALVLWAWHGVVG